MKKSLSMIISALSAAVILCGCSNVKTASDVATDSRPANNGAVSSQPEYSFVETPDYSQTSMYLDESDLTSEGKVKFNLYNEYTFPDGDAPEHEYEKRVSPDGEEFYYDNENMLRYYKNGDAVYNKQDDGPSSIAVMSVCFYAKDFLGAFMGAGANSLSVLDYPENVYTVSVNEGGADAIIRFTNESDVRWFAINYEPPFKVDNEQAFTDKLEKVISGSKDKEISRGVRYAQIDGTVYALFTVGFEGEDGTKHTELYGFSDKA